MEELEKAAESAEIELNLYFDFGTRHCFLKRQNYPPIQTVRYTTNAPNAQEKFLPVWLAYTVGDAFVDSATSLERKAFAERVIGQNDDCCRQRRSGCCAIPEWHQATEHRRHRRYDRSQRSDHQHFLRENGS